MMKNSIPRWLVVAFLTAGAGSAQRAVIDQYCVSCHNDKVKAAGLSLNTIGVDNVNENTEIWEKGVRKLRARYMPPVGLPRPHASSYNPVISTLEASLDPAAAAMPNMGRTATFR